MRTICNFLRCPILGAVAVLALLPASNSAVRAGEVVLPIWQEIFARPKTSLAALPSPQHNRITKAKVQLGGALFFDRRLSGDQARSCASCHMPALGFSDGRKLAEARDGREKLAHSPSLFNLAWGERFFWDGRADSLERQVVEPILNPQELAGDWPTIIDRLGRDRKTASMFEAAFGPDSEPSSGTITKALASYVRSLISVPTRFEQYIAGDKEALSNTERHGFELFVGKAGCVSCHWGWRFTDDRLHVTGLSHEPIKTPGLRSVANSGPYMHDGSKQTLEAVVGHYVELPTMPGLSPNLTRPLNLNGPEIAALVAFLKAL